MLANCPNGSKSAVFILNWQAKVFRVAAVASIWSNCERLPKFPAALRVNLLVFAEFILVATGRRDSNGMQ